MLSRTFVTPKGILYVRIYAGKSILNQFTKYNLIVTGGREAMAKLLAGEGASPDKHVATFGAGANGTTPTLADTALNGAFTKSLDPNTFPTPGTVQFNFNIAESEGNGLAIAEFGLFCADGTLFNRVAVPAINKTSAIRIEAQWQIVF